MASINREALRRYRYPLALTASILGVAAAGWMVKNYLDMREQEIRQQLAAQQNLMEVVVANKDLPIGAVISAETMSVRKIPSGYIPDGAVTPGRFSSVEGKTISEPMTSGRPLVRHNIKDISRVDRFSDLLGQGQRALTLEVSGTTSVEHMLEAGDEIDLAVKNKKSGAMVLLLEKVTVLATGNVTTADPKAPGMYKKAEYDSLTLGVDTVQVPRILAAEKAGELVFLLRNGKDELRSRYATNFGGHIEVIVGKGAEGGILPSVSEALSADDGGSAVPRNAQGRLLQKLSILDAKMEENSNTDVAVAHE